MVLFLPVLRVSASIFFGQRLNEMGTSYLLNDSLRAGRYP